MVKHEDVSPSDRRHAVLAKIPTKFPREITDTGDGKIWLWNNWSVYDKEVDEYVHFTNHSNPEIVNEISDYITKLKQKWGIGHYAPKSKKVTLIGGTDEESKE